MHGDRGRSDERTGLAWQRTALAVLAAAAFLTRLTFHDLGMAVFVVLGLTSALCLWVLLEGGSRYRRGYDRGGRAAGALTLAVVTLAGAELAALMNS